MSLIMCIYTLGLVINALIVINQMQSITKFYFFRIVFQAGGRRHQMWKHCAKELRLGRPNVWTSAPG